MVEGAGIASRAAPDAMDEQFITLGQYETAFPGKVKPEVWPTSPVGPPASSACAAIGRRWTTSSSSSASAWTCATSTCPRRSWGCSCPRRSPSARWAACPRCGRRATWRWRAAPRSAACSASPTAADPLQERVEVASGPLMYQLYNYGDRDWAAGRWRRSRPPAIRPSR